jgi:serine/threonine protein kinase
MDILLRTPPRVGIEGVMMDGEEDMRKNSCDDCKMALQASPSSCSSASTRLPDSDSEEFLLDGKEEENFSSAAPLEELECSVQAHAVSDPCDTNLAWFRRCIEVNVAPWKSGDFTTVGRLASSVLGEVHHYTTKDGRSIAAKVMPTEKVLESQSKLVNERELWLGDTEVTTIEDPWNEIAVLSFLQTASQSCDFILRLHGIFQDANRTYVLTEYCEGGELFEQVAYGEAVCAEDSRRYLNQILAAVQHLHSHNVGHRDISLENVLLQQGSCVLMDFGQAVRLRTIDGTELRYFAEAGKRMYRSPEMYVPREQSIQVICPSDATAETVVQVCYDKRHCLVRLPADASPGFPCRAQPYGYAVAAADLFACGVCAFLLTVGKPPWAVARDIDPTYSFIRRQGVACLLRQWRFHEEAADHEEDTLLAAMLQVDPLRRASIDECLRHPWLSGSRHYESSH